MPTADTPTLAEAARAALAAATPSVVRIGRAPGRGCGIVVADGHVLTNAHNLRDRTTEVTFADGRVRAGPRRRPSTPTATSSCSRSTPPARPRSPWADDAGGARRRGVRGRPHRRRRRPHHPRHGQRRRAQLPRPAGSPHHRQPRAHRAAGPRLLRQPGGRRRRDGCSPSTPPGWPTASTWRIPADAELRARVDALVRGESVHRLVLGVGLAPADVARQLRASVGLADREGLLVRSVAPDSPAERRRRQDRRPDHPGRRRRRHDRRRPPRRPRRRARDAAVARRSTSSEAPTSSTSTRRLQRPERRSGSRPSEPQASSRTADRRELLLLRLVAAGGEAAAGLADAADALHERGPGLLGLGVEALELLDAPVAQHDRQRGSGRGGCRSRRCPPWRWPWRGPRSP